MATNQLTKKTKEEVWHAIELLLLRGLQFNPCPLESREECVTLFHSMTLPDTLTSERQLRHAGYELHSDSEQEPLLDFDATTNVWFHLREHRTPGVHYVLRRDFQWGDRRHEEAFGGSLVAEQKFVDWVRASSQYTADCAHAGDTASELLSIVNTAGQLRRMAPELCRLLPPAVKNQLAAQERTSPLKAEQAAFSQADINKLTNVALMCSLMPDLRPEFPSTFEYAHRRLTWAYGHRSLSTIQARIKD